MTTQDNAAPTEDQVKAANAAEVAKWQGDFDDKDLIIPYKRSDDNDGGATESTADAATGTAAATDADESENVQYAEPEPVVTVQDPGDFKPQDYSFEIEIKGKTHKVDSAEKAAELADEFAEELTAKQLVSLISKGTNIDVKSGNDRSKWEDAKAVFDAQTTTQAERTQTIENLAGEFEYLVGKGLLPAVAAEYRNADWNDPEVAKQPGVKEQIALMNYMVKENDLRAKAKVKPITSMVDAFNAWSLESGRQDKVAADKAAGDARKAASSRVAAVSSGSSSTSSAPAGIAVGNPNVFKRGAAVWDN